jgi:hypothetical protein
MIYGFCLNRFRYGLLSVASRCSAVVDDEHKTLNISNQDEANAFPAQAMPLEAVSSISSGHGPCSMMLKIDFLASKSASGRAPLLFIEFHRASDRASFYEVLEKESGERKLQIDEYASCEPIVYVKLTVHRTADRAFRRWEDNIPEPSVEELHEQLAAKQSEIESLQKQLADAHIGQQNATTDPEGGYQLDDMLPFQISQVLRVLNGYDRKEEQLKDVLEELADAQDQIARQ